MLTSLVIGGWERIHSQICGERGFFPLPYLIFIIIHSAQKQHMLGVRRLARFGLWARGGHNLLLPEIPLYTQQKKMKIFHTGRLPGHVQAS